MSNTLIDFYKTGISHPQLKEGIYTCSLKSHELVTTNPNNPYITLTFETTEGRVLKENRFNQGFQIFISHLKQQLGLADEEISVQDFLNDLIKKKTAFKIWITKYTPANGGATRSNFNFLEPRVKTNPDTDIQISTTPKTVVTDEAKDEKI